MSRDAALLSCDWVRTHTPTLVLLWEDSDNETQSTQSSLSCQVMATGSLVNSMLIKQVTHSCI